MKNSKSEAKSDDGVDRVASLLEDPGPRGGDIFVPRSDHTATVCSSRSGHGASLPTAEPRPCRAAPLRGLAVVRDRATRALAR